MEVWSDVKGYEGIYFISTFGRVKNRFGKMLKPSITRTGYPHVQLSKGKTRCYNVHRLVAEAFIPNPKGLPIVNHKDENRSNNKVDNLEWCTYQYNASYGNAPIKCSESAKRLFSRETNPNNVPVRCVETNEIFKCIRDASDKYLIDPSTITKVCKGKPKRKTAGGLHWEYVLGETE